MVNIRQKLREKNVLNGVIVATITAQSAAARLGLRYGDLISAIGSTAITDIASFARARDASASRGGVVPPVTFSVWRNGEMLKLEGQTSVPFGVTVREYSLFLDSAIDLVERNDSNGLTKLTEANDLNNISIPHKHWLMGKILAAPDTVLDADNPTTAVAKELRAMLRPNSDMYDAWRMFNDNRHKNAAAFMIEEQAKDYTNIDMPLNYGLTIVRLKRNAEAIRLANEIKQYPVLSAYGRYVAAWILSQAAENEGRWLDAYNELQEGVRVYRIRSNDDGLRLAYLATKMGDASMFKQARETATAIKESDEVVPYLDTLEAFLVLKAGKKEEARTIVVKWLSNRAVWTKVMDHWKSQFPEIATALRTLG